MQSPEKQELIFRRILTVLSVAAAVMFATGAAVALWTTHGITEVESIIAAQATALSSGGGLYYDLDRYPFTVSPYGPILYGLEALGVLLHLPPLTVGRVVSLLALGGVIFLVNRLLRLYTKNPYTVWTGTLMTAASANLVSWGSLGQSDMLGLLFSVAALERYSTYRLKQAPGALLASAVFVAAAIFSKQSFIAAGATISILFLMENPRGGLRYVLGLGTVGVAIALTLNWATSGGYWANAVIANLNPFAWHKLTDQLHYFVLTAGSLALVAVAGLAGGKFRRIHPFALYLALSTIVFLATSPKIGSDLNYQIETVTALTLCAALALERLNFFPLLFADSKRWITLLQLPVLLYIALNCAVTGKVALQRIGNDLLRQDQFQALAPYLSLPGRIVSVEIDPLLHSGRPIEVEPLIFTMVADAGMSDPTPVLEDLEAREFSVVILYEDLFDNDRSKLRLGTPTLPDAHLDVMKANYSLVDHLPGPFVGGLYIYTPNQEHAALTQLTYSPQVIPQ